MSDVNVNFPPSASPVRFVSAGDVDAMITQIKADVEGQVSELSGQVADTMKKYDGVINLKEWNLFLDGVRSDRPALVLAIELWKTIGGKIKLPKGLMYIEQAVELPNGITIEGTGMNSSIFKTSGTNGVFKNSVVAKFVTLRDFMISAPTSGGSTGVAMDLTYIGNSNFDNIYITGFNTGVRMSNVIGNACYYNTLQKVRAENCKVGWDINTNANGNNFIGCRAIQCENGVFLDQSANANTFVAFGIEIHTPLANPAYGFKFGVGVESNVLSGCRIEITGPGESIFCTDPTADYNMVFGSTIYTQSPLSGGSSFKGFSGTGGKNNSVINGKSPTTLKGVASVDSVDSTLSPLVLNGKTKTPNADAFRLAAYRADLVTLWNIITITGATDSPVVKLPYDVTFDSQGLAKFARGLESTKAGEGIILKSPDGLLKKKITIDNTGAIVLTTV